METGTRARSQTICGRFLRIARELRRETEALGVTSRQVTLLWLVRSHPGLSLRELASEEGISAPALSDQVDRLESAGLLDAHSLDRRPPQRRAHLTPDGRPASPSGALAPDDLARGPPRRDRRRTTSRRSRTRCPRSQKLLATGPRDECRACEREDVPQPPASSQLPPLLRRPGHLGRRELDAERRARLAGDRSLGLAARSRCAGVLPLSPVHGARSLCRGRRRPDRHAAARDRDPGGGDAGVDRPRGRDASRPRDPPARLPPGHPRRHHARLRRLRPPDADVPDGRATRASECRCAQLGPLQRLARRRPDDRRRVDRSGRDRRCASRSTR